jgi:hypothetical protein
VAVFGAALVSPVAGGAPPPVRLLGVCAGCGVEHPARNRRAAKSAVFIERPRCVKSLKKKISFNPAFVKGENGRLLKTPTYLACRSP